RAAEVEAEKQLGAEVAPQGSVSSLALVIDRLAVETAHQQVAEERHGVLGLEAGELLEREGLRIDQVLVVGVLDPREAVVPGLDDARARGREARAAEWQVASRREGEGVDPLQEGVVADREETEVELAAPVEGLAVLAGEGEAVL